MSDSETYIEAGEEEWQIFLKEYNQTHKKSCNVINYATNDNKLITADSDEEAVFKFVNHLYKENNTPHVYFGYLQDCLQDLKNDDPGFVYSKNCILNNVVDNYLNAEDEDENYIRRLTKI